MAQCSLALRSALAGRLISLVDQGGGGLIGTSFRRLDLDVRGPAAGRHGTGTGRPTVRRWMVPRRVSDLSHLIAAASYCFAVFFAFSAALASRTFAFSAALALASRTFSHARTSRRRN